MNRHSAPDTRLWSCLIYIGSFIALAALIILVALWTGKESL